MKKAAMAGALGFGLLIALLLSMFLIIASDEDSGGSGSGLYILSLIHISEPTRH